MSAENPKQYTPEEIAKLEKSRTISDAELLQDGAEYQIAGTGEKVLEPTEIQKIHLESAENLRKALQDNQIPASGSVFSCDFYTSSTEKKKYDRAHVFFKGLLPNGNMMCDYNFPKSTYFYNKEIPAEMVDASSIRREDEL